MQYADDSVQQVHDPRGLGCYDRTYRTVSSIRPTETEVHNRRLMSDVVTFVRTTNNTIKQHVSEAARLDEQLQSIAESYFPETFNNDDLLLEAMRHYGTNRSINLLGALKSQTPSGQTGQRGGSMEDPAGNNATISLQPRTEDDSNLNEKNDRVAHPLSLGRVLSGHSGGMNMQHMAALAASVTDSYPQNVTGRPTGSASGAVAAFRATNTNNALHRPFGDHRQTMYPQLVGSRSEAILDLPSSLTGTMPPRTFSAQLRKKSLIADNRSTTTFEKGPGPEAVYRGLDPRSRVRDSE